MVNILYLAEHTIKGRKNYTIRDSLYDPGTGCWQSRDLCDLGSEPGRFIQYPGGNSFYIADEISERITSHGVACDLSEMEELFWKFIRREIREKLEPFHCRGLRQKRSGRKGKTTAGQETHLFDKRRFHYLRSGAVDQRSIKRLPGRYFSALLCKSRDEIEQYFLQMEKCLQPGEYKQYVYAAFDLQRYFAGHSARFVPQALDQGELDRGFLEDLCALNDDPLFWTGFTKRDYLHEYLVRYAVMFFDYEFDGRSAWAEYLDDFLNSRRFYRPPPPGETVTMSKIVEIFGVSAEELDEMDKNDLTKLFRQKAHEFHPDKGGEHEEFVRLAEAYKQLLRQKK